MEAIEHSMAQIGLAEVETLRAVHDANRGGRPHGSQHEHLSVTRPHATTPSGFHSNSSGVDVDLVYIKFENKLSRDCGIHYKPSLLS